MVPPTDDEPSFVHRSQEGEGGWAYHDTIAAISTPPGEGGIGIVRLSGPDSVAMALRLFQRRNGRPLADPTPGRLYHGDLRDPADGALVDEVLLAVQHGPRSYTGEDTAEISAHGGPHVLRCILALALTAGARLAEPGEFTRRAFENGRLDLAQAEAVLDIIRARSDAGLRAAEEALRTGAGADVHEARGHLITLLATLEAALDFAEEDIHFLEPEEVAAELVALHGELTALVASHRRGKLLREGAATVIVGRPNTGKSSLLNALLREERAIVTEVPGTTRDVIEETIAVGGVPLRLLDTAGIRDTHDLVERHGVKRSRAALARADLVLLVLDASQPLTADDQQLLALISERPAVIVLNKADLPAVVTSDAIVGRTLLSAHPPIISLSALTGDGIPLLEKAIHALLLGPGGPPPTAATAREDAGPPSVSWESAGLANLRRRDAAARALDAVAQAQATLAAGGTEDLLAVDLRTAADALGEITGETVTDDVLESIFSRFCIGK
jgi:tRNA modification GTPase